MTGELSQAELMEKMIEDSRHEYKLQISFPVHFDMSKVEKIILDHFKEEIELSSTIFEFYDENQITLQFAGCTDLIEFINGELTDLFDFQIDQEPYYERMDFL